MEVGSEVYSLALSFQLQRIISSPLTQELRLSPVVSSIDAMLPRTQHWNATSLSDDVINAAAAGHYPSPSTLPFDVSLQPPFADFVDSPATYYSNASDSFYSHANQSFPDSPSSSSSLASSASAMQDLELYYRHSTAMNILYCVAYSIVFIVGLIGNSFVIAVVLRAPRMRTVTNYFIVNLALADILVIIFCLPATLTSNIFVRK